MRAWIAAIAISWFLVPQTHAQPAGGIQGIISERISSQVSAGQAASVFGRLVKFDLAVSKTKGQIARVDYQSGDRIYLQHFTDGTLLVWDFDQGAQVDEFRLSSAAVPFHYEVAAARLLAVQDMRLLRISRSREGAPVAERLAPENVQAATASGDGRIIFAGTSGGEVIKLAIAGAPAWRSKAFDLPVKQITGSHDGTRVTALDSDGLAKVLDGDGRTLLTIPGVARLGGYDRSGRQIHLLRSRETVLVSAQGAVNARRLELDGVIESIAFNDTGDRVMAISSQGRLSVGNGERWEQVDSGVKFGVFLGDRRFLSVRNDGVTHLRSLGIAHYLVAIVPGSAGWVIVDHEGRYDGTVDGTRDVKWNAETGALGLDQFFEAYYQPGLLSAYLKGDEANALSPLPGRLREGVYLPPKVQLDFPEGKMKPGNVYRVVAVAESNGGDLLEEIRLFHNGKRLAAKARIGTQRVQKDGRMLLVQVFAFVPEAGPNELFAEIRNVHGITGRSEIKREITEGFRPAGRLHVVGIGIDQYRLQKLNLDFATADVKTFVGQVAAGAKQQYDQVVPTVLLDAGATRGGVKELLDKLGQLAPEDSLILALAGHGDFRDGEWYFLPHDIDPGNVAQTGVSAKDVQDALVASPVRRIFLMVDACNSGAGIDSFNRYRAFQRRFAQQVGRNAGVSVLTATRRDQGAAEVPQLGHGLFTHTILEGLGGAADNSPRDGRISAHELANFVGQNLEARARPFLESLHLTQTPSHFVIGSDFLISDVRR